MNSRYTLPAFSPRSRLLITLLLDLSTIVVSIVLHPHGLLIGAEVVAASIRLYLEFMSQQEGGRSNRPPGL